ncbi:MAG: (2Fe-2S)-binding protein [Deltaproteobacteria bacterium]|nr:(2Fe-2S)-binding protein [Deltaproteobacteria bacterium]
MKSFPIRFNINDEEVTAEFAAHVTLLQALRELGHMEVKNGCEKGDCGSCAVFLDGVPINACLVLAVQAHGRDVTTVRDLGTMDDLHPLQVSFIEHGAIQCGFCTPGMLVSAKALLDKNPSPTREDINQGISGNLCRCTGYVKIVDAIGAAAGELKKSKKRSRKR